MKVFNIHGRKVTIPNDLDSTANFKVNSVLKAEFESLCKSNHSNVSRELKIYMEKCVKHQSLEIIKEYY